MAKLQTAYFTRVIMAVMMAVLLAGCATLRPNFDTPTVTVSAFRVVPTNSINPSFEIDLHIINPNNTALELRGVAYTASIEGYKVLSGVANQLPVIAAYGEGDVRLLAAADLLGSFRLLNDLMREGRDSLSYTLDIKLDVGSFVPAIYVQESGEISLQAR